MELELAIFCNQARLLVIRLINQPSSKTVYFPICKICSGNCGTKFVRVVNQKLVQLEAHAMRGSPWLSLAGRTGTSVWIAQRPKTEPDITRKKVNEVILR